MEDTEIIERYWRRDETAIAQTDKKYGRYCYCVAQNVLHSREDSQECVNDTWLKAWNSIPPQRPDKLGPYLAKITRNLAFNKFEEKNAKKRGGGEITVVLEELEACIPDDSDIWTDIASKELAETINRFVHSLSRKESDLFVRRYFFTEDIKTISKRYGLSENNVTVSLSRIRRKLRKYLEKEDYII